MTTTGVDTGMDDKQAKHERNNLEPSLSDEFVEITLEVALAMAHRRRYVSTWSEEGEQMLIARFDDGVEIAWESQCCGPYSDVTPDLAWEPPKVFARILSPDDPRRT